MGTKCCEKNYINEAQLKEQNIPSEENPINLFLIQENELPIKKEANFLKIKIETETEKEHKLNKNQHIDCKFQNKTGLKSPKTQRKNSKEKKIQAEAIKEKIQEKKNTYINDIQQNYYSNLVNSNPEIVHHYSHKKIMPIISNLREQKLLNYHYSSKLMHKSMLTGLDLGKINLILGKYSNKNNIYEINHILKNLYGICESYSNFDSKEEFLKKNTINNGMNNKSKISQYECYNQANFKLLNRKKQILDFNNTEIKIQSFIPIDFLNGTDKNIILIEGDLFKYHPGFKGNLIKKWCCSTKNTFEYFKNQYSSKCYHHKPIFSIPIKSIQKVSQINYKFISNIARFENCNFYYFEIIMKKNIDNNHILFSENGEKFKDTSNGEDENKSIINRNTSSINKFKFVQSNQIAQNIPRYNDVNNNSNLINLLENVESISKNINFNPIISKNIQSFNKMNSKIDNKNINNSKQSDFLDSINHNDYANSFCWPNREFEWLNQEKRLIFASPEIEEFNKWVEVLNWLTKQE